MTSRAVDEWVLTCLRMRCEGMLPIEIAAKFGVPIQKISTAVNRIADADMKHDPEASYPWRTAPRKHGPR